MKLGRRPYERSRAIKKHGHAVTGLKVTDGSAAICHPGAGRSRKRRTGEQAERVSPEVAEVSERRSAP
jgi:hypothetical protein